MSRVGDAMRRLRSSDHEQSVARAADVSFVYDEDAAVDSAAHVTSHSEIDSAYPSGPLVRRDRAIPIEVARGDSGDDIRIFDLLRTLYRRRWLMAAVIMTSAATAMAYNNSVTPLYEAHARLLVEPNSPEVVPFRPLTEDQGRADYYATQLEVLRSRALARRALEYLHRLDANPMRQAGQIGQLLGGLSVTPSRTDMGESRVINVAFQSEDPKLAAQFANGLVQAYVDQNLEARRQGSRDATEWLNQRLAELQRELNARESALQQYRQQSDSVSLGQQENIVAQKLTQLNTLLTAARTERMAKQAVFEQFVAMKESGTALDTFSPILGNPFIQGLKAELAGLQRERVQLAERLRDLHPDMIKVTTAIANAERRLNAEMAKVAEGIQNEYRAAQAHEQALIVALEDHKREVLDLNQKSIGYGALQRDAASTQQMFETVRQRAKETELSGELQSNNAKILDLAEVPSAPVWPRSRLNLILAILGGGFIAVGLAVGLEYLNPRIDKPADIIDSLDRPLLGIAPQVRALKNRPATLDALPASFQEALRAIRTRIFLSPSAAAIQSIAVTSTNPGEGKTVVASTLAASMAMGSRRVLLIDADLRGPQLHRIFDIAKSPGLSEVIAGTVRPSAALVESSVRGLFILPAGAEVASPTDLLDSKRLNELIQGFSRVFDVVVLDCPPVMAVSDASIIANAVSSVLFVVGSGTNSEAAQIAMDRLASVQAEVIGVVLNKAKVDSGSDYGFRT